MKQILLMGVWGIAHVVCAMSAKGARTPFFVNEDAWYFMGKRPAEEMNVAGLKAHIDRFAAGGKVTHMAFCVNGMRMAYPTKVGEPMWRTVLPDGKVLKDKRSRLRDFYDAGIDPFKVWIDRCREKGISPWISMRINDVHFIQSGNPRNSCAFWRAHPELRRRPDLDPVKTPPWNWTSFAFNYAKKEVRDYHFAIFREIADRYDADGYELDTLRFWQHLTPGREREEAHFLTAFIQRCRAYTRELSARRGRPIRLSARVPTSYAAARAFGFDAEAWARSDAVDLIVVCNFFGSVDFIFDFADWRAKIAAANPRTRVLPGATDCFANEKCRLDRAAYCGWADYVFSQGADGVYLYNTSYLAEETKRALFREGLSPETVARARRRHPRTYHDCVPKGGRAWRYLPAKLSQSRRFVVQGGSGPHKEGRVALIVGVGDASAPAPAVTLNGRSPCAPGTAMDNHATYGPDRHTKKVWRFPFAPTAAQAGSNDVCVAAFDAPYSQTMLTWAEIEMAPAE